jgi:ankyrin repeat protein
MKTLTTFPILLFLFLPASLWAGTADPLGAGFDQRLEKFHAAALTGRVAEAKAFLREPGFTRSTDSEGHDALFAAACAGNLEILDAVLELPGLDVNRRDAHGATPLFYAASAGRTTVLRHLLARGADPNIPNAEGKTPLIAAVMLNQKAAAEVLLAAGATVGRTDATGASPLFYAAQMRRFEMAKLLIEHGADPNQPRHDGSTPLSTARGNADDKIMDLLKQDIIAHT